LASLGSLEAPNVSTKMSSLIEPKFEGWMGLDEESVKGKMVWQALPNVKEWTETDVDIEVTHCGVCKHSNLHPRSPAPSLFSANLTLP